MIDDMDRVSGVACGGGGWIDTIVAILTERGIRVVLTRLL